LVVLKTTFIPGWTNCVDVLQEAILSNVIRTVAIQGERGSNSHIAAQQMLDSCVGILACTLSPDVVAAMLDGRADAAVLPIENSLHGSVADHYDLLLEHPLRIDGEHQLRIEHNLIAAPGVQLDDIRAILSHAVALSQCRRFLADFRQAQAQPFFDTAGSIRHIVEHRLRDTAGIAPRLAAEIYGADVVQANIEDHPENFTRFHLLRRADTAPPGSAANKISVAFSVEHRPGTLVRALEALTQTGANLTKIESRPVAGRPWEYVFFADLRFDGQHVGAEAVLAALHRTTNMVKELGRYAAA
jgi:prephenate dehydratase